MSQISVQAILPILLFAITIVLSKYYLLICFINNVSINNIS